jgi:hypothetical protein
MSKLVVLSELKKYINMNDEMMKGTYIKTLEKEAQSGINKTTELHTVKVGDKFLLVPIVKKEDIQEEAINNDMLSKLLSKIKNQNDRDIVKQYVIQQNLQEVQDIANIKKAELDKEKDVDGAEINEDTKQFNELKTKYQKELQSLRTIEDYTKLLSNEEFQKFQENLRDNKLNKLSGLLSRTMNAVKRKLETKEAIKKGVEAEIAETVEQKIQKIKEKKETKRAILAEREKKNIEEQKAKAEAEKKAKEEAEKKAKEAEKAKAKPKAKPKAEPKETEAQREERILTEMKAKEKTEKKKKQKEPEEEAEELKTEKIQYQSGGKTVSVEVPKKGEKEPTTQKEANELYGWNQSKFDKYKEYIKYKAVRQSLMK